MTKQATELAAALQEERDQSAGPLAHGGLKANDYQIKGYQQKTDRARENFLDASEQIDAASKDGNLQGVRDALVGLANQLDDLAKIRKSAYTSKKNATQTVESYHRLITQLIGLSQDMAEASSNPEMISRTRALAAFSTAKEYASVQRAMIASALPATTDIRGDLSENDRLYGQSAYESGAPSWRSSGRSTPARTPRNSSSRSTRATRRSRPPTPTPSAPSSPPTASSSCRRGRTRTGWTTARPRSSR